LSEGAESSVPRTYPQLFAGAELKVSAGDTAGVSREASKDKAITRRTRFRIALMLVL